MYDNIKLDRSLYNITGKSFTQALTELDPDEGYADTELRGLDAFERQLKRFGIKVSGAESDMVEKFFVTAQSAVLFPEYVRRMIKKGMEKVSIADVVCGAVSRTDGIDFRGFTVISTGYDPVNQGDTLPETTVMLDDTSSELKKFARLLKCSYESVRKQRLEAFGIILRELGASVGRGLNTYLCAQLSDNADTSTIAGDALTYADLAAFWSDMSGHDMDVMVCSPAVMAQILAMDEMKYVVSDFMSTGRAVTPYGVTLIKCQALAASNKIIGIDSTKAAEVVFGSDVTVDADRLLTSQKREISCSVSVGVSRISDNAVKVLNAVK